MTETKKNPIGQFIENTLVPISTAFAQIRPLHRHRLPKPDGHHHDRRSVQSVEQHPD